MLSKKRIKTLR